ncbi:tryptophan synthase subunit alpha [Aliamphritea ceti]|uniref:tryptophan synthase subunit alpha n=1 Tax=Aliamphritea ceti TaxID=1524258 RepID=UPI0021C3CB93|nr:tryptophan synthase subunit alpha [Aliamphritea ceti]
MSDLTQYIRQQRSTKSLLLMTHVIYGYPTINDSLAMMRLLLDQGVEILEVQFPFSDPVADGPAITHACHQALADKPQLEKCISDISKLASEYPQSRVLLMSYLNPVMQSGPPKLATLMQKGISGIIVPDIAVEQQQLISPLTDAGIEPIWIITPDTQPDRLNTICKQASGMLYCVSRAGVTGESTDKNQALGKYLNRIGQHTELPLGVGFGISTAEDIQALLGHADIAIIGSAFLNAYNQNGLKGVHTKLAELKQAIT